MQGQILDWVSVSFITFSLIIAPEILSMWTQQTSNYCQTVMEELDKPMSAGMCPDIIFGSLLNK